MYKVCIPSYKREKIAKTQRLFSPDKVIIAVGMDEVEKYKKELGEEYEYLGIPKERNGNIAKARNFILENAGTDYILMMDDDVDSLGYFENGEKKKFTKDEIDEFIVNGFNMAIGLNVKLWGINMTADRMAYREYSPISFQTPILGTFSGIIKTNLRYDEELYLKEDYDFFLQHLQRDHKILRFNKYHYNTIHLTIPGGCANYRTMQEEKRQAEILKKRWGDKVVKIKNTTNPTIYSPYKGI